MLAVKTETMLVFLRALASGEADLAIRQADPDGFVLHDPSVGSGVAGLRELAGRSAASGGAPDIARVIVEDDFVVVHGRDTAPSGAVFFAVARFKDDRIAEHWRFTTPPAAANLSGHTQTDGPNQPVEREDFARTKALVRDYYETVHIRGDRGQIDRFMSDDRQIRHEPGVRDGVGEFKHDLERLTKDRTIDEIALLVAQGDLVFVAARGTHAGDPCVYTDLYRVEAGQLVEHWGFPQAIPPRETWKSAAGLL